jgi:hypothetical protein
MMSFVTMSGFGLSKNEYQSVMTGAAFKMANINIQSLPDEQKIQLLQNILEHFGMEYLEIVAEIRMKSKISPRSEFFDDLYDGKYEGNKPFPWTGK